jgi:murein DD-endopeptidase MepM/ murein hydrolase activator NlpD
MIYPTAVLLLLFAACQPQPAAQVTVPATQEALALVFTPIPTAEILTPTATPSPSQTPTLTPASTFTDAPTLLPPTATDIPPTATASPSALPTTVPPTPLPARIEHYVLDRPIERRDDLVDYANRAYPYGGTQFGQFDVHLGIDMENARHTPIRAAAPGRVYYAGSDSELLFGPYPDYYGNLVVIAHDLLSSDGLPLYTLYGHMQRVDVRTGDIVEAGQTIGTVGDSGIALGPHLHFEVRAGIPEDYRNTRNPDLYIRPYPGFGTLAGRLVNTRDPQAYGTVIYVRSNTSRRETYTYGGDRVNSDPGWGENFTLGDLPEGTYEVIVSDRNGRVYFRQEVVIQQERTTWLDIAIAR